MMLLGVLKRIVPFFLTFAAGLFIASFFVTLASPSFNFQRRSYKMHEMRRLRDENRELKRRNEVLQMQLDEARREAGTSFAFDTTELPLEPPPPPPPPRHKHPLHGR